MMEDEPVGVAADLQSRGKSTVVIQRADKPQRAFESVIRVVPFVVYHRRADPMLEILMIGAVVRHYDRAELVSQIRVTRASQQRRQKRGFIKIVAAAFQQRQLRALFRAEIVLVTDVV